MLSPEGFPRTAPQERKPHLTPVEGEGSKTWHRTPEDLNITRPITPDLFEPSNLLRKLRSKEGKKVINHGGRNQPPQTIELQRTSRAAIIGEVYHLILNPGEAEFGKSQQHIAEAEEIAYVAEGQATDQEYQLYLMEIAHQHESSAVLQGIRAFASCAYDFYGEDLHGPLFKDAERFAAHLIHMNIG